MHRKIMCFLTEWKESKYRKSLILQGARQVGKTYSILEFGCSAKIDFVIQCDGKLIPIEVNKQNFGLSVLLYCTSFYEYIISITDNQ